MPNKLTIAGKPISIIYTIENEAEFAKENPLNYRHNGLIAHGASCCDLMEWREKAIKKMEAAGIKPPALFEE